jgi:hypothetical protein
MSTFTPSGSAGSIQTVEVSGAVSVAGSANPTIANVVMATAATEYSYALPADTRKFYIKLRDPMADLQLAYTATNSATTYITVHRGNWFGNEDMSLGAITLYFQSPSASQTVEIESWT